MDKTMGYSSTLLGLQVEIQEQILDLSIPARLDIRTISTLTSICTRLRHVMLPILRRLACSYPRQVAESRKRWKRVSSGLDRFLPQYPGGLGRRFLEYSCMDEEFELAKTFRKNERILAVLKKMAEVIRRWQDFRLSNLDAMPTAIQDNIFTLCIPPTLDSLKHVLQKLTSVSHRVNNVMLPILKRLHESQKCETEKLERLGADMRRQIRLASGLANERSRNIERNVWRKRLDMHQMNLDRAWKVQMIIFERLCRIERWNRPQICSNDWVSKALTQQHELLIRKGE